MVLLSELLLTSSHDCSNVTLLTEVNFEMEALHVHAAFTYTRGQVVSECRYEEPPSARRRRRYVTLARVQSGGDEGAVLRTVVGARVSDARSAPVATVDEASMTYSAPPRPLALVDGSVTNTGYFIAFRFELRTPVKQHGEWPDEYHTAEKHLDILFESFEQHVRDGLVHVPPINDVHVQVVGDSLTHAPKEAYCGDSRQFHQPTLLCRKPSAVFFSCSWNSICLPGATFRHKYTCV